MIQDKTPPNVEESNKLIKDSITSLNLDLLIVLY